VINHSQQPPMKPYTQATRNSLFSQIRTRAMTHETTGSLPCRGGEQSGGEGLLRSLSPRDIAFLTDSGLGGQPPGWSQLCGGQGPRGLCQLPAVHLDRVRIRALSRHPVIDSRLPAPARTTAGAPVSVVGQVMGPVALPLRKFRSARSARAKKMIEEPVKASDLLSTFERPRGLPLHIANTAVNRYPPSSRLSI
jgi:hypothetical protein